MIGALKTAKSGPLFAYQTGLSGSDPRLLAHLAQETGGAVFAVVGEAEIARASTAQRQRPWRLADVEMSGGHDLLLAGRPQFVFPGQQLLLVGRCEPGLANGEVTFTLKQGETTQTVRTKIDRVLTSELAARDLWPGGGRAIGRRGRRGGGRRADCHGLRPALPHHRADLLAIDARIGAGLRPLRHQAGRGRFSGVRPAGGGGCGQGRGRKHGGPERPQGELPGLVSAA